MDNKDRLVFSTKESIYPAIEIEIDAKVYQSVKLTRAVVGEMAKIEAKRKEIDKEGGDEIGDEIGEPNYELVEFLFKVDKKELDKLDKREVEDIVLFVQEKIQTIEAQRLKVASSALRSALGIKDQPKNVIPKNPKRPGGKN